MKNKVTDNSNKVYYKVFFKQIRLEMSRLPPPPAPPGYTSVPTYHGNGMVSWNRVPNDQVQATQPRVVQGYVVQKPVQGCVIWW